jgi:predicted XRE-type DNA-binding protein
MSRKPVSSPSSGNPFADLGMSDAETRLAKARLAQKITAVMHEHDLTQEQVADKLGIDQPQVSKLTRGQLKNFSLEKLLTLVTRLDMDVAITITQNPEPTRPARLTVSYSEDRLVAAGERHSGVGIRFD